MAFKDILVALDGSEYSQLAADYAMWLASEFDCDISAQHVVDPRIVDFFIAPEFGEELGFSEAIDTSEKVFRAVKKIGTVILDLYSKEAVGRGLKANTFLDVGHIVDEVSKRAEKHDLLVIGHRGKGHKKGPSHLMTGSVAERVILSTNKPVLVAIDPVDHLDQFLVAYDGSEASIGALLAAERLAMETRKGLEALMVVSSSDHMAEARLTVEQGEKYLREYHSKDTFSIKEGPHAKTLMDHARATNSLLVLGAYGFNKEDDTVLGSTATYIVRRTKSSILVFR
jgi:nucleotide-binding universal stress UspA family protein